MTSLTKIRVSGAIIACLGLGHAASAQDMLSRALQGCENQYNNQMRVVCNAPIRARVPRLQQRCYDELEGHRARCIENTQRRYENAERRRSRLGR